MFNSNRNDDNRATRAVIREAVAASRAPGQASRGNASGAYSAIRSSVIPATETGQPLDGGAGVDEDGNRYFPFLLDVDRMDDEEAKLS